MSRKLLILQMLVLTGCATLNEDECRTTDWREQGLADGRAGHPATRLAEHHKACVEYKIVPDDGAYREGRKVGLEDYCVLGNAVREGSAGRRYQGVCPPAIDRDFRDLNYAAYAVQDLRSDLKRVDGQIDGLERKLRDDKTSDKRRVQIRDEIRTLDRQREQLHDDLRHAERHLQRLSDPLLRRSPQD